MSQRIEQDWLNETSIREHIDAGGTLLNHEQARVLLDLIDRLRSDSNHHKQAAVDISDENDKLRKENISLNQSAKSLADVNHQLQKELFEQNQLMNELFLKAERLEKLVQPDPERGPGFVGQGSWSVYAEKVVAERDAARAEVVGLCKDVRDLEDKISELDEDNWRLQDKVKRLEERIAAKKEHSSIDTDGDEIHAISGYGSFRLTRTTADSQWSIALNEDKVALYNRKGRRVRAKLADW